MAYTALYQEDQSPGSVLDQIEIGERIPILPIGVAELLKALTDEDIDMQRLTEIISHFPVITSRLMFLANSAWAMPITPIASLSHACSKLGLSVIRSICLALSIAAPFNPMRCSGFDVRKYWVSSLMVAETAKMLAARIDSVGQEDYAVIHTAGVLHNIGMLWLADCEPELTSRAILENMEDEKGSLSQYLKNHLGAYYTDVNGRLAQVWNFPERLTVALHHHNNPDYRGNYFELALTLGISSRLVDLIQLDDIEIFNDYSDSAMTELKLSSETVLDVVRVIIRRQNSLRELVDTYLSAA